MHEAQETIEDQVLKINKIHVPNGEVSKEIDLKD